MCPAHNFVHLDSMLITVNCKKSVINKISLYIVSTVFVEMLHGAPSCNYERFTNNTPWRTAVPTFRGRPTSLFNNSTVFAADPLLQQDYGAMK